MARGGPQDTHTLELDTRRRIFETVQARPGAHLRDIERRVGLAIGQVSYHLQTLENRGLVGHRRDGGFKRFFAASEVDRRQKVWIIACRHEAKRRILVALLLHPGLAQARLAELLDLAPSTIAHHVHRLFDAELLTRTDRGLEVADPDAARNTLLACRASYRDPVVDRFAATQSDQPDSADLHTILLGSTSDPDS